MKIRCLNCKRKVKLGKKIFPHCKTAINYPKPVKRRTTWFIKFFLVLAAAIAAVIFALWAVGNTVILNFKAPSDARSINGGDISFMNTESEAYSKLPNYVKEMLPEKKQEDNGPVLDAILPYVGAEVEKIDGYFGKAEVTFLVCAPDVGNWLRGIDIASVGSSEALLSMMCDAVPTMPLRFDSVTVKYNRKGIFDLEGNFKTAEFANALYGGFNEAYNEIYEQVINDIKEALGQ